MFSTRLKTAALVFLVLALVAGGVGALAVPAQDTRLQGVKSEGAAKPDKEGVPKPETAEVKRPKTDLEQLQGAWKLVESYKHGKRLPVGEDDGLHTQLAFQGKTAWLDDKFEAAFEIDPKANPRRMTIQWFLAWRPIFKIEGDTLTLCYNDPYKGSKHPHPNDFTTPPDSPRVLRVYKRERRSGDAKPKAPAKPAAPLAPKLDKDAGGRAIDDAHVYALPARTVQKVVGELRRQSEPVPEGKKDRQPAVPKDRPETVEVSGRVIGADGKAVAGANVSLIRSGRNPAGTWIHRRAAEKADAEGRFHLSITRAAQEDLAEDGVGDILVAAAKGHGPGWLAAGELREVTLRLVRDDVPIEGRVLDLEGRPIAGVGVRVLSLAESEDLGAWLDYLRKTQRFSDRPKPGFHGPGKPGVQLDPASAGVAQAARTGTDGRIPPDGLRPRAPRGPPLRGAADRNP